MRKQENVLQQQTARAYHIVHSHRVRECMETVLEGLHVCIGGDMKPVRLYAPLYASIVILSTNLAKCVSWNHIKTVIDRLRPTGSTGPKLLDEVVTVSTPFGDESFFNTLNVGHISNIFGDHECLLLLDTHLSSGCQGGAVYNRNM